MPLLSAMREPTGAAPLRRALLAWYDRHRRAMPWRETRDPYAIWVSEVMLQQTQVATATPYYLSFLERFPTLERLARAGDDEVLAAWAGLGYYRRARHLHAAARTVLAEHGGVVPADPAAFSRLPGVGRYTTGAVLSIAFDRPLPVLDGNVARVLSRLFAAAESVRTPAGSRRLWSLAASLVPQKRPGDWNQALMELGATVCTPRAPRCSQCPARKACRAFALGRPEVFPPVSARRPPVDEHRALVVIERRGRVLMARHEGRLLDGLWEPPGVVLEDGAPPRAALGAALRAIGVRARLEPLEHSVRHAITHRRITAELWRGILHDPPQSGGRVAWIDPADPARALTALARKALAATRTR